jgi:Tfp pilus assembly protein PilZ
MAPPRAEPLYPWQAVTDDRRTTRRAQVPGVRAVCVSTRSEQIEADVRDLGKGGLFVRSVRPLSVGQRLSIDIWAVGEPAPWSVLGRIVWTREAEEGEHRPAGMGIKLIVVDDPVAAAIDRLVDTHERMEAVGRLGGPTREMTVLGVGPSDEPPVAPPAPIISVAFAREPTVLGVGGMAETPSRELSVAFELVSKRRPPAPPPSGQEIDELDEEPELPRSKARTGPALILLVLLSAAAATVYMFRDRLRMEWREWGPRLQTPAPAPAPKLNTDENPRY